MMVAKSGIEPVNGVFAVVFKIKSASIRIHVVFCGDVPGLVVLVVV